MKIISHENFYHENFSIGLKANYDSYITVEVGYLCYYTSLHETKLRTTVNNKDILQLL